MRCFFQRTIADGYGNVLSGAICSVYLSGTPTPANIYITLAGTTPVNSVTADSVGYFSFYVDRFEYDMDQLFDIIVTSGSASKEYYNMDIDAVVLGTYNITYPKTISTYLVVPKGVFYNLSSNLAIAGVFAAGNYQIFTGSGTITFSADSIIEYNPVWFGTGITVITNNAVVSKKILVAPLVPMTRTSDPDTTGWGESDVQIWRDSTSKKLKMWNGEKIVLLG